MLGYCKIPVVWNTLTNLILYYIQNREIVHRLQEENVTSVADYQWQRCLKYYWDKSDSEQHGSMYISMINTQIQYGFEYMGCSQRLVLTPTTERAFR